MYFHVGCNSADCCRGNVVTLFTTDCFHANVMNSSYFRSFCMGTKGELTLHLVLETKQNLKIKPYNFHKYNSTFHNSSPPIRKYNVNEWMNISNPCCEMLSQEIKVRDTTKLIGQNNQALPTEPWFTFWVINCCFVEQPMHSTDQIGFILLWTKVSSLMSQHPLSQPASQLRRCFVEQWLS